MKRLSEIADGDWKGFRCVARRYERELRCISRAIACDASRLRQIATKALAKRLKKQRTGS